MIDHGAREVRLLHSGDKGGTWKTLAMNAEIAAHVIKLLRATSQASQVGNPCAAPRTDQYYIHGRD